MIHICLCCPHLVAFGKIRQLQEKLLAVGTYCSQCTKGPPCSQG